jgi:hypothetical protein
MKSRCGRQNGCHVLRESEACSEDRDNLLKQKRSMHGWWIGLAPVLVPDMPARLLKN